MKRKLIKLAMCAMAVLPMGAWAADVQNKATATWMFDQFGKGVTLFTNSNNVKVFDFDGLYAVVGAAEKTGQKLTTVMARLTNAMKDGDDVIFSSGYYTGLDFSDGRGKGIDKAASEATGGNRLSLQIVTSGTLYVLCRNRSAIERTIGVFQGNATTASASTENTTTDFQMIKVNISTSARYHITGFYDGNKGTGFQVYAVKFVSSGSSYMDKTLTIPSCGYATFSGPHTYTIAAHTKSTTPEVYYATAENGNSITLTLTDNNRIPACSGVIIKGAAGDELTLRSISSQQTVSNNLLVANLAAYALPVTTTINKGSDATYYNYIMVADGGSNAVFKHTSGSGDLSANKAFLRTTTNVASARGLELNFGEGDVTGISEIEKLRNVGNEKFFDLQGRLVAQPTKGLYIVNGKKVIIK